MSNENTNEPLETSTENVEASAEQELSDSSEPAPEETPSSEPVEEEAKAEVASTQVIDSTGRVVRTYDIENHGEEYHDIAVKFAASEGHSVKAL